MVGHFCVLCVTNYWDFYFDNRRCIDGSNELNSDPVHPAELIPDVIDLSIDLVLVMNL